MNELVLSPVKVDDLVNLIVNAILEKLQPQQQTPESDPLIKIDEVCKILNVSKVTVFNWKKSGKIPFHRISSQIFFRKSEVLDSLKRIN
jgi:excisionase family DNA binding protein